MLLKYCGMPKDYHPALKHFIKFVTGPVEEKSQLSTRKPDHRNKVRNITYQLYEFSVFTYDSFSRIAKAIGTGNRPSNHKSSIKMYFKQSGKIIAVEKIKFETYPFAPKYAALYKYL